MEMPLEVKGLLSKCMKHLFAIDWERNRKYDQSGRHFGSLVLIHFFMFV